MSENLSYLAGRPAKALEDNLFERLGKVAVENEGSAENPKLKNLAREFLVGDAIALGAASFYDFLKAENQGKKVYTCNGSACMLRGTQEPLRQSLKTHFKEEEIGHMCCLGRCHENAAFHFAGQNYSARKPDEITAIVSGQMKSGKDNYGVTSLLDRPILTKPCANTLPYYQVLKKVIDRGRREALAEIKESKLRGRGGAGFPLALKLESCMNSPGGQKYIVCNADEGDPGAFSDRYLLEQNPHAVLFGMMVAGFVVGADTGVLYIRAEYPESVSRMTAAIEELQALGLHGKDIQGWGFNFRYKVIKAAGAYICGEETALLSSIEGQRPEVRVRPPYPTQAGLFNQPTVVSNVETFANLHQVMSAGGKAYAAMGTEKSTGSKLLSLDGFFVRPGILEVEMGMPLKKIIEEAAGGFNRPVKALHIGGPLGGIVPVAKIADLTLDYESFSKNGFLLGHASIICIPQDFPMMRYLEHLFEFTAVESCGKCFPCRLGSKRGQEMLEKSLQGNYKIDRTLFNDLLESLELGSLCALGGGLPLGIKNAMHYFADELKPYFKDEVEA